MPTAPVNRANDREGKHLGQRHGQPDTFHAEQQGQSEEAEDHEDEPPQEGHRHRRTRPLDALEITDRNDINREKDESRSKERKSLDSNGIRRVGTVDEHRHNPVAEQRRDAEERQPRHHGRRQRQPEGLSHPHTVTGAEIVAQDRLGRLPDGVVDHEDDREEVAGDAECRHAVLTQIADKDVIPGEHHRGDSPLAKEGRKPQPAHITHVAEGQAHAFAARLHPAETHDVAAAAQVAEDHGRSHDIAQARSQRRTHHAPAEDENENVVQYDVDNGGNRIAEHRIVGRPVEPDEEHARTQQCAERQERREPVHIFHRQREEPLGTAQQQRYFAGVKGDQETVHRQQERRHHDGLRDVDTRRLDLPLREVDRRHDRSPDTEHQPDARADQEQRRGDVDRRQRIAADAASHENPVRDYENGRENHPQDGGDQQFPK